MKKNSLTVLFLLTVLAVSAGNNGTNPNPKPKPKQQPSNCIKQPEIVKKSVTTTSTTTTVKTETKPVERKVIIAKGQELNTNTIPHFSIFNFFNSFYTKDTLDRLQVM